MCRRCHYDNYCCQYDIGLGLVFDAVALVRWLFAAQRESKLLKLKSFTCMVKVDAVPGVLAPVRIDVRRLIKRRCKALNLFVINDPQLLKFRLPVMDGHADAAGEHLDLLRPPSHDVDQLTPRAGRIGGMTRQGHDSLIVGRRWAETKIVHYFTGHFYQRQVWQRRPIVFRFWNRFEPNA